MPQDQFEKLAQMMKEMHDDLSDRMDAGFAKIHEDLTEIRAEIRSIKIRLDILEQKVDQHSGFAKEVDYLLSRVAIIEQRLGITHQD